MKTLSYTAAGDLEAKEEVGTLAPFQPRSAWVFGLGFSEEDGGGKHSFLLSSALGRRGGGGSPALERHPGTVPGEQ